MDLSETLTLYQCLAAPHNSDSELSNDESSLPRVNEIIEIENIGKEQKKSSGDVQQTTKGKKVVRRNSLEKRRNSLEKEKGKIEKEKGKKTLVKGTKDTSHRVVSKSGCSVKSKPKRGLDGTERPVSKDLEEVEGEATRGYEGSEDCSTDNEQGKELVPTRRKRTASGSSIPVYGCPFENCGKEFNRPWRLVEHKRLHTGERPHKCPEEGCDRTYTRRQHLQRHTATAHQEAKPQEYLKCDECSKFFKNKYSFSKHFYRAHVRENYKCEECGQIFRKQQHLRTHSYEHTGIKPYGCEYPGCNARFTMPSRLKRHTLQHEKNCYVCPNESCKETFDLFVDLRNHLAMNHPKACDVCGRMFRQLRKLRMHRKSHDSVREAFFCPAPKCDRHFYEEKNLAKHYREKHEETSIYMCGVCKLRLSSKQKLVHHMTTHSPSYKRSYGSHKPRKPRKDKGISRTDYARLLSGYTGDELGNDPQEGDVVRNSPTHSKEKPDERSNMKVSGNKELLEGENRGSMMQDPSFQVTPENFDKKHSCCDVSLLSEDKYRSKQMPNIILSEDDMEKLVLSGDDLVTD